MDTLARGLRVAERMINDGITSRLLKVDNKHN
jgi:xylose isomerase